MASTIQIKRGTGSAVPSGLADGELAINLDNRRLYFGSGSTSVNDFSFGEITAEKYIVSSSVLYVTTSFSSGSTEFGDTADDTHTFTGNITSSGNISASGDISSSGIFTVGNASIGASLFASRVFPNGPSGPSIDQVNNDISISTGLKVTTHITASGNVSASGTIIASNLSGTNTGDQDLSSYSTITQLNASSSTLQTNIDAKAPIANPSFTGNITASGDISASGAIYSNNFLSENGNIIIGHHSVDGLQIRTQDATPIVFKTNGNNIRATIAADGVVNIVGNLDLDGNVIGDGATDISGIDQITTSTLRVTSTTDASVSSTGHAFQAGATNSTNVIIDNNEIMARNNSALSDLHLNPDGGNITFNNSVSDKVIIGSGHITASGNISSSGDINSSRYLANEQLALNNVNGAITLGYDNTYPINIGKSTNPIGIYGNITSSGNISSSGNNYASAYYTDNYLSLNTNGTQGRVFSDASITEIQIGRNGSPDKNIELLGPVTASGNISASLNSKLYASSASFGGAAFLRSFNVKGAGLDGRLSLQGASTSDNPGIEMTVNDNTSRVLMRLNPVGSNGTELAIFTEPDGGSIAEAITVESDGNLELNSHDIKGVNKLVVDGGQDEVLKLNTTSATGNPFIDFSQNGSRKSFIQHNDTNNTLKIASEFGAISLQTATDGNQTERVSISNVSASFTVPVKDAGRTIVKILPTDFVANDGGRPVQIEDDSIGSNELFLHSHSDFDMYAYIEIPYGMTATHVKIFGSNTGENFTVYEASIINKTIAAKCSATAIESEADITDVPWTDANYLVILVTSAGATDEIHGGYVKIEPS